MLSSAVAQLPPAAAQSAAPDTLAELSGPLRMMESGWYLVHSRRVDARDLNAYGTLFGGILLGEVFGASNRFLEVYLPTIAVRGVTVFHAGVGELATTGQNTPEMSEFVFSSALHAGESLHILVRPTVPLVDQLLPESVSRWVPALEVQVLGGAASGLEPLRTIASCTLLVHQDRPLREAYVPQIEWHFVQSRWVIGADCLPHGHVKPEKILEMLDEAAVSFCRDQGKVGRFVTRKLTQLRMHHPIRLDDTLKVYFRVVDAGRSSLTIAGEVVRTYARARGEVRETVMSASLVMVATDETGKPIRHALTRLSGVTE